jgi:hypothetical protein
MPLGAFKLNETVKEIFPFLVPTFPVVFVVIPFVVRPFIVLRAACRLALAYCPIGIASLFTGVVRRRNRLRHHGCRRRAAMLVTKRSRSAARRYYRGFRVISYQVLLADPLLA